MTSASYIFKLYFLSALFFVCSSTYASDLIIRYPKSTNGVDPRDIYTIRLLQKALPKAILKPSSVIMNQGRAFDRLYQKNEVDIVWAGTNKAREENFLPIRIPIFKGAIGLRVAFVHPDNKEIFKNVKSIVDLFPYTAVQGQTWPEVQIYEHNNINVATSGIYEVLFKMISKKRVHYFPRSIVEVDVELEKFKKEKLFVEPYLLIQYPLAVYFFVHKDNKELKNKIEEGLTKLIENGEFDKHFYENHNKYIKRLNLHNRTKIFLPNPNMSDDTPYQDQKLWFKKFPNSN